MLLKSTWFVFIVTVLVLSINAVPNSYKSNNVRGHEVEGIELPALKRQDQPWRNETKASVPSTTTRELLPIPPSSSSITELRDRTSIPESDKISSMAATPTRSLSSGPEGSASVSIGPITSNRSDMPSASVAVSSLSPHTVASSSSIAISPPNAHVSTSTQAPSLSPPPSSQTSQLAASSIQVVSSISSKFDPVSDSPVAPSSSAPSSQHFASEQPPTSSGIPTPISVSASSASTQALSSLIPGSIVEPSQKLSTSSTIPAPASPTFTQAPSSLASSSAVELSQAAPITTTSISQKVPPSSVILSQQVPPSSIVPSQQVPSPSILSSQQESPSSRPSQIQTLQSSTPSWTPSSITVSLPTINISIPVPSSSASRSIASLSSLNILPATPVSQVLNSPASSDFQIQSSSVNTALGFAPSSISNILSAAPISQASTSQVVTNGVQTPSPSINPGPNLASISSASQIIASISSSSAPPASLVSPASSSQVASIGSETRPSSIGPAPISAPSSNAGQSDVTVPGSSALAATTVSQTSNSQVVSSGSVTRSSWIVPVPSDQTPVSLSTVTSFGAESAQGLSSSINLAPSNPTPLSSSATILPGGSQGLSSPLTIITSTVSTITSDAALPSVSSSASIIRSTIGDASSSAAPSRQDSSAYVSVTVTETFGSSASFIVSATSLVLPQASTGVTTLSPSATTSAATLFVLSTTGTTSAVESMNRLSPLLSASSIPFLTNGTLNSITSAAIASSTLIKGSTGLIQSSTTSLTESRPWTSPTMSSNMASLNSSSYTSLSATSSVALAAEPSLLPSGSASSLSSAVHLLSTTSVSQQESSATPAAVPSSNVASNGTSSLLNQVSSETAQVSQGWNISSTFNAAVSTNSIKSTGLPNGSVSSSLNTLAEAVQTSTTHGTSNTTNLLGSYTSAASLSTSASSTLATLVSITEASRTLPTLFSPTTHGTPASSTAAATLPPPPLTTPQKAGVAIAGTTGLILAVVAAIYLTRRHYTKKEKRLSTGSDYLKLAYLYDPRSGGNGGEGDHDETFMSGGSSGMPLMRHGPRAPTSSPQLGHRHSTGTLPARFSDAGNPFQDTVDPFRDSIEFIIPTTTAAAFSAAVKGYTAAPQRSPSTTDFPIMEASRDIIWPAPLLSPPMSEARLGNRSSILSEIASMAYNPNVYNNASVSRYERLSPYGFHQNHSLPTLRETTYTESLRDPFEHDLPLQVDFRTATPDSVTLYAPPAASTVSVRGTTPIKVHPSNPWASSMLTPSAAQPPARPLSRLAEQSPISPDATIVASERFSLMYESDVAATYLAPSPTLARDTKSPISPPPRPVNRGWDDIKRRSADKVVPSPVALSPPLRYWSPPPSKKKSLPQLRRKEGVLFNSSDATRSIDRLPLKTKIPFTNYKNSSAENTRLSQFGKSDTRSRNDESNRNPDSTFHHSVHSLSNLLQKKKSGNLEFACAGV